jgi:hypothetical protein
MQSAALKVVPGETGQAEWHADYDLRVDEHNDPVTELARLVRLRRSQVIDQQGYDALKAGQRDQALTWWAEARSLAPELEETAYWQAMTLADEHADVATAAAILRPVLAQDSRRAHWIDLTRRLQTCGLLERAGAAEELIAALG